MAFSKHIEECMIRGKSTITFVIGGSLGLGKSLLQRANYRLCFSKMTFPHQLMKLILVEQVYRAFKIMNNQTLPISSLGFLQILIEDKNIMNKAQWIHSELDGLLWLKIIYVVGIIFIELKRDEVKNVNK